MSPTVQASIYELELSLTDQTARALGVDVFRGHPVIVSMFYASCPYACPTLISDIKRLEKQLDPRTRARVRVLLVSLDPERDTPERLKALAALHGIDQSRWRLARAPEDQVRELAAVLGLKYRKLKNGEFNHSSVITVLDGRGMIQARLDGLEQPLDALAKSLEQLGS
jgi:protein SCO1/2